MTDQLTAPTCPACGSEVEVYDHRPGYQLEVQSPLGGKDWLVGTADEIYASPDSRMAAPLTSPKPNQAFTKVALQPCGHDLEADEATGFLVAAGNFRLAEKRKAAERVLDADRDVLDAAGAAGHHELVDRYRQAVYAGNGEAAGLRVALTTLGAP